MSMKQTLNTSALVTADSPKGQRATETFRGQYNKAELDEDSGQRLNEHPGFSVYLAEGIRRFSAKAPDYNLAKARGITYTNEMLLAYGNSLPSVSHLEWCYTNGMILVPGPASPTALLGVRDLKAGYFYSKTGGWYANDNEKFSRNDKVEAGWLALLKKEVTGSLNENWSSQKGLVVAPMIVPNAGEALSCIRTSMSGHQASTRTVTTSTSVSIPKV
ncbi:MAG: hypothetical protein US65_C0009G0002 [Candidatus Yanofskybacteria bacterium GW2011_GWC2_37_9]|uniref:Uncharacterized protein n=1 Tax=Candidatus Yanofskybacteria bacterium GW2011_GWC2_37_9 TaxID=1619028 RepID=A0A0G0KE78_9BACT|nr:MAG: hypothetical protein US65_C0009G0002 [Candidatus Yanofskybacteria bacterium GW2011_GWC2_37_9]